MQFAAAHSTVPPSKESHPAFASATAASTHIGPFERRCVMFSRPIYRGAAAVVPTALILALAAASGCTSPNAGVDRTTAAVKSMNDIRLEAVNARTVVDETMATLNSMPTTDDLRGTYNRFSTQVDQVAAQSEKLNSLSDDLKSNVQAYIKQWGEEMSQVNDPSLVVTADQRRLEVQKHYREIQTDHQAFSDAYSTFYEDLTSLRSYLANNLTAASVKAAEPTIKKANDDRAAMKTKADTLLKAIHDVARNITTPPPQ
jgi:hypothetical protein